MSEHVLREINRRMTALELTPITLAKKAGLHRDAVRDMFRRKPARPSYSTITALAKALGCAPTDLTGERPPAVAQVREAEVVSIPELDVHVSAGLGGDDGGTILAANENAAVVGVHTYPIDSFREALSIPSKRIRIVPVRGNSMEPELWPGQRVMVDIEDKTPSPPGIFVVWDGLGLVLKFVEVVANSTPLRVRISSAHKAFLPYERNLEEAYINGRVVGVWKRM